MSRLAAILLAACGAPIAPVAPPAPKLAVPACSATIELSREGDVAPVLVNGIDTGLDATLFDAHMEGITPVVWPLGPHSILVTWRAPARKGGRAGSPVLYEVDCTAPGQKRPFVSIANADFGDSAMTADGNTLFFSIPDGVRALDLPTKHVRAISLPPTVHMCAGVEDWRLVDVVTGYDADDDVLEIDRGGSCGFEGDWEGGTHYIDHPANLAVAPVEGRVGRPVSAVAVDAAGTWWASANGRLSRSSDGGAHWEKVPLTADTPAARILADPKTPGALVVESEQYAEYGPAVGGWIYTTHDAGKTWKELRFPDDLPIEYYPDDSIPVPMQHRLHASFDARVAIRESVDHVVLWGDRTADVPDANGNLRAPATWETRDGGVTWKVIATTPTPERTPGTDAHAGSTILRPSADGLLVIEPGARKRHVYIP